MATDWLCSLVPDHGDIDDDDGDDDDDDRDNDDDNEVDDDDGDDDHGESYFFSSASMSKCRLGHTLARTLSSGLYPGAKIAKAMTWKIAKAMT